MGTISETFAQLDKLEEENKKLKAAVDEAAKFMSKMCVTCPCEGRLGCERPVYSDMSCVEAVKRYFLGDYFKK